VATSSNTHKKQDRGLNFSPIKLFRKKFDQKKTGKGKMKNAAQMRKRRSSLKGKESMVQVHEGAMGKFLPSKK